MKYKKGFTLIELLVVVAIIGILSSVVLASLSGARSKAKVTKASAELRQIEIALTMLNNETGRGPGPAASKTTPHCGTGVTIPDINEVYLDVSAAGLSATDGNFLSWKGPYMQVPKDPWGNSYWFDEDYTCVAGSVGCANIPAGAYHRAIVSGGPNASAINSYDTDNVVQILCVR